MNARPDQPAAADDARVREVVGARIRRRRKELGLTMKQLGERVPNSKGNPTPPSQVSKWELGVNLPKQRQWRPLSDALAIDQGQLFAGTIEDAPDWALDLTDRVELVEDQLSAAMRVLGITDAVAEVIRAGRRFRGVVGDDDQERQGASARALAEARRVDPRDVDEPGSAKATGS